MAKPKIYRQVRPILQAQNLIGALASVAVLTAVVNKLSCFAPAACPPVDTRILTLQSLPTRAYYDYLALYNLAYIADDSPMLAVAVTTLSRQKLQERGARTLKLIREVVMLALGSTFILRPKWLGN